MIHIIKNYKWVIGSSLICIIFGLLTFFTFINQSFIKGTFLGDDIAYCNEIRSAIEITLTESKKEQ